MRVGIFAALLCLLAQVAPAADLPGLYDVTGVASDDALNVRQHPRASATRVGELRPDAVNVEVTELSESGAWGRINIGETDGWVAMRYLAPRAELAGLSALLQYPFACLGTEPFWSLSNRPGESRMIWREPEGGDLDYRIGRLSFGAGDTKLMSDLESAEGSATLSLRAEACDDGMSDRHYSLEIDVLLRGPEPRLLSGCCSLAP